MTTGDVVVRVDGVRKRYRLGQRKPYRDLREVVGRALERRSDSNRRAARTDKYIWALDDVSFEVRRGEALGIIGPNGAGKSTLLKILSRITRPTEGRVALRGRVGSLLEVGTGFHPELTGRDNLYLNGVILGMKRDEVRRKFDEIVEFAGIERFLDTPVKRYSSGMYVRLAFAVAAHFEPEIMIVDEVLAVGDAEFQRKCLGKMHDVARGGRTVLFVSHNMNAVQRLCPRALALKRGRIVREGETRDVVPWYLADTPGLAAEAWFDATHVPREQGGDRVRVVGVSYASDATANGFPYPDGPIELRLVLESDEARLVGSVAISLSDQFGTMLVNADSIKLGRTVRLSKGRTVVRVPIRSLHLEPGTYNVGWWVADALGAVYDHVTGALHVEVVDVAAPGFGMRPTTDGVVTADFDLAEEPEP